MASDHENSILSISELCTLTGKLIVKLCEYNQDPQDIVVSQSREVPQFVDELTIELGSLNKLLLQLKTAEKRLSQSNQAFVAKWNNDSRGLRETCAETLQEIEHMVKKAMIRTEMTFAGQVVRYTGGIWHENEALGLKRRIKVYATIVEWISEIFVRRRLGDMAKVLEEIHTYLETIKLTPATVKPGEEFTEVRYILPDLSDDINAPKQYEEIDDDDSPDLPIPQQPSLRERSIEPKHSSYFQNIPFHFLLMAFIATFVLLALSGKYPSAWLQTIICAPPITCSAPARCPPPTECPRCPQSKDRSLSARDIEFLFSFDSTLKNEIHKGQWSLASLEFQADGRLRNIPTRWLHSIKFKLDSERLGFLEVSLKSEARRWIGKFMSLPPYIAALEDPDVSLAIAISSCRFVRVKGSKRIDVMPTAYESLAKSYAVTLVFNTVAETDAFWKVLGHFKEGLGKSWATYMRPVLSIPN